MEVHTGRERLMTSRPVSCLVYIYAGDEAILDDSCHNLLLKYSPENTLISRLEFLGSVLALFPCVSRQEIFPHGGTRQTLGSAVRGEARRCQLRRDKI